MVNAVFYNDVSYANTHGLWQYDYGQVLRIQGLSLPAAVEVHFSLTEKSGQSVPRIGVTRDGVTDVVIPDSFLENGNTTEDYNIFAFIYLTDDKSGQTEYKIKMNVQSRPKPEAFDKPEDAELFREAIKAVNDSADRAESAEKAAKLSQNEAEGAAQQAAQSLADTNVLAEQVHQDAEKVNQDKQAVSRMVTETSQNTQKAAESAQAAEGSGAAAKQAQTAAESAEAGATAAMEEVEQDRIEVNNIHQAVDQLRDAVDLDRQAVAANRRVVENTVTQFEQAVQNTLTAVGQAQKEAVGTVAAEGQKQTTAVQQTGRQVVSDVTAVKTQAVQAVSTEGNIQTQRVQDAAAEIIADRDNIASLQQGKADAIVETAQGETMTIEDSSGNLFRGIRIFGKSTQDGIPAPESPAPIVSVGDKGNIIVTVESETSHQSLILQTPDGLPGVKVDSDGNYTDKDGQQWVCDEIDLERGKYVQRIMNYVFNGTEEWFFSTKLANTSQFQNILNGASIKKNSLLLCNKIKYENGFSDVEHITIGRTGNVFLHINNSRLSSFDANGIKNWLSQNIIKIMCQLEYPIERDLTHEELAAYKALHSNYPTTIISNDESAHMEVSYAADTKNYIAKTQEPLKKQITDLQNALISQKIVGGGIKVADSAKVPLVNFTMWGKTEQGGIPTLDNPSPVEVTDNPVTITVRGGAEQQSVTLVPPRQLTKWDKLEKVDGVWMWVFKSGKTVFSGNKDENWMVAGTISKEHRRFTSGYLIDKLMPCETKVAPDIFCTHYKAVSADDMWGKLKEGITVQNDARVYVFNLKYKEFGAEEFAQALSQNPITLYYESVVTEYVPLTAEEQSKLSAFTMYAPETEVSNNGGCQMELTYTVDTKSYVDSKIAENSKNII